MRNEKAERHASESWHPENLQKAWMPAFAGMTLRCTAIALISMLTACGQTGPLYIEQKPADVTYPTTAAQLTPSSEVVPSDDS